MHHLIRSTLKTGLLCALLIPGVTLATVSTWRFMQGGFFYGLSETDAESLKAAVSDTLSNSPDAAVVHWTSQDGKREGKIYPRFSYESQGKVCRRTFFKLRNEGAATESHRLDLCEVDGIWRVTDSPGSMTRAEANDARRFLSSALSAAEAGEPLTWFGEKSGHTASVVALTALVNEPGACRDAAISMIDQDGNSISGRYRFCLGSDAQWLYAPSDEDFEVADTD